MSRMTQRRLSSQGDVHYKSSNEEHVFTPKVYVLVYMKKHP